MDTALHHAAVVFNIDLHPSKSIDIKRGVQEYLNTLLMRWNDDLEGIVLCYTKQQILGDKGEILISLPYVHVQVSAVVTIFKPVKGHLIDGVVNKVGVDHLGLLVLGVLNASIGIGDVDGAFEYDEEAPPLEPRWTGAVQIGHQLQVGDRVRFRFTGHREVEHLINLRGELGHRGTGNMAYLGTSRPGRSKSKSKAQRKGEEEAPAGHKKSTKDKEKRKRSADPDQQAEEIREGERVSEENGHKKKKRKRSSEGNGEAQEDSGAKTPKKSKKDKDRDGKEDKHKNGQKKSKKDKQ